jgi:hypothetical protein
MQNISSARVKELGIKLTISLIVWASIVITIFAEQ